MTSEQDVYAEAGEVSCAEAREIADRYNNSHWRGKQKGEEARYTIPADPRRDDDIRLEAFIRRAEAAFKRVADAERELELLARLRAHSALDWHLTDIEGARDAAESPEAREICELTMALLSPGDANGGGK